MNDQDAIVIPKMPGEGKLQRSSWKAEAIRRGDLKISGPIPITEDIPLNEEEEREYAAKHSVELPSQPLEPPTQQQVSPQQPSQPDNNAAGLQNSDREEAAPEVQETHHELRHKRSSSAIRETSEMQRRSDMLPAYNSPSPFQSLQDSSAKSTPKKKRKSGLRNVFRKMFGRKSKEESMDSQSRGSPAIRHGHHQSDPGMLRKTPEKRIESTAVSQRISDLPVRELKPINPLGQHLPFPMNVNAPQEVSPPQEYLTFDGVSAPALHRRRATLPSVVVAQSDVEPHSAVWGHADDPEAIPSPEIGVAVSSPTQPRRRSRSAGALRELAKERESTERRRSEEIKYWRSSYRSGSVYTIPTPRPQTARTIETVVTQEPATEETIVEDAEPRAISVEPPLDVDQGEDVADARPPVEAFNFGILKSEFLDDDVPEEEMAHPPEPRYGIEDRVQRLESTMHTLETSVRRISGRSNRQTIILENVPKGRRSRNRSTSSASDRQYSRTSSTSNQRPLSITQESAVPPSEQPSAPPQPQTAILEPSLMPRNPSGPAVEPAEQFAAVYTILKHERAARKALEQQVLDLQREVTDLHALVDKLLSGTRSYPTPSPDTVINNEERLRTPRPNHSPRRRRAPQRMLGFGQHHRSGDGDFDVENDDNEENIPPGTPRGHIGKSGGVQQQQRIVSRFSRSDSEGGDNESSGYSIGSSSKEDVTSPADIWATPTEGEYEGFFGGEKITGSDVRGQARF